MEKLIEFLILFATCMFVGTGGFGLAFGWKQSVFFKRDKI